MANVLDESQREGVQAQIARFLRQQGRQYRPELLSEDREAQAEINALIERAGWQLDRRKVLVRRELAELPAVNSALTLLSLA